MRTKPVKRYQLLDGLRGVAAMTVMLGHLSSHSAHIGIFVDFFFVLSGFVLTKQIDSKATFRKRRFIINRIIRFYPMLIGVILFVAISENLEILRNYLEIETHPVYFYIGSLFLIQIVYSPIIELNSPLWSLSAEFWINIIAIFIVTKKQVLFFIWFGLFVYFAGIILSFYLNLSWQPWMYTFAIGRAMTGFFLGRLLGMLENSQFNPRNFAYILLLILLLVLVAFYESKYVILYIFGAPISFLFIREILKIDERNVPNFVLYISSYIGKISFGVYIWHYAIMQMTPNLNMWAQLVFCLAVVDVYCRFLEKRVRDFLEKVLLLPAVKN